MKLSVLATQYVAYKQDLGMRFRTEARTLRSFCRTMGDIDIAEATAEHVLAFIAGPGPVTRFWHRKHEVLRGFYRFTIARDFATTSPLPRIIPQAPQFVPHVFSHEEVQRLLGRHHRMLPESAEQTPTLHAPDADLVVIWNRLTHQ